MGGDWVGEAFRKHTINVAPSAKPKADIYVEILPMLNATRCSTIRDWCRSFAAWSVARRAAGATAHRPHAGRAR